MDHSTQLSAEYSIRQASLDDLDSLVAFILAEAREAEGLEKDPEIVAQGIQAGLLDPGIARYWVLENREGK